MPLVCEHGNRHVRQFQADQAAGVSTVARGAGFANGGFRSGTLGRRDPALLSRLSCIPRAGIDRGSGIAFWAAVRQGLLAHRSRRTPVAR